MSYLQSNSSRRLHEAVSQFALLTSWNIVYINARHEI